MSIVRKLVSQNKIRFVDSQGETDLDLAYITQRIIAMGFPSSGIAATYRNPQTAVAEYFDTTHPGHYKIFNLAEEPYDQSKFSGPIEHCPFPDHHSPPIPLMLSILKHATEWLDADKQNVVAIHCIAGMGRTGTIISSLMLFLGIHEKAEDSLSHFANVRTGGQVGVKNPCQLRYVKYAEELLRMANEGGYDKFKCPELPERKLKTITFQNMYTKPKNIYITIQNSEWDVIYNSAWVLDPTDKASKEFSYDLGVNIKGDFIMNVYEVKKGLVSSSAKCKLYFTMTTLFIHDDTIIVPRNLIDGTDKDKNFEKYTPDFQVIFEFQSTGEFNKVHCLEY
ncbi:phosphatidylinositol-3,4,5-trisphosphate 3-phosphatase, putative [Trichomonas vaginalis G3]|uniref:Phosphatidylinositol 3,4,5-trisphosphate 3-phosphatase and dual-specificity protein phosphatase PTEN n=1 Tax=Trichomonas vaginalis (strain ATCC PRA-98 / G3) TaxID=412133 RepID=A2DUH1_TRIV3|nr:phosphatidylinositol-3,4,5-trisphosphate 3-phosphatase protein [Trichomonas vaginalis G3]EAY16009.1 phosphatidylinositol-3,4,5-trisphosphate 3-phosphatase, putative [Trichomonas vaginalis G3]KAI5523550.1 phosphatidylinositol-3,4,5-trisphosphate 3-phosphatase protein [Trichomonas vaginalis G3]|eukprot:XP_001328232.1 phosphatidylinositol-3,4,5-trisphosphate 3-phosphatase [Trichomonas vaginalis G3]